MDEGGSGDQETESAAKSRSQHDIQIRYYTFETGPGPEGPELEGKYFYTHSP